MRSKLKFIFLPFLLLLAILYYLTDPFNQHHVGKQLVIGRSQDAISLDPAITTDSDSFKVTVNLFENLVKYAPGNSDIMPSLAESWKVSEDGLTWTFKIRKGVQFHNGDPLTADSIVFNFERWMKQDNPYHTGQFSYWLYNFEGFPGIVKSVTALSDYSVEIVLKDSYAPFLSVLATPAFGISSPNAIMTYNETYYQHPVGTGPFKLKEWLPGELVALDRNEQYWGTKSKVDRVVFKVIPSADDRLNALESGEIHMADHLTTDDLIQLKNKEGIKLYRRPFYNVGYLALNNQKEPLNHPEVRKAIQHLIDKDKLVSEVFYGLERKADSFLPPLLWGHHESLVHYEYSPEKAASLLKASGVHLPIKLKLWVMDTPRPYMSKPIEVAEFIKKSLEVSDIEVDVSVIKWETYIQSIKSGNHQMALIGWNGDTLDPDNFLYTFLSSENTTPEMASNYAFYKNDEVDFLLKQAREITDKDFRKSLYRELQEIVQEDAPSIPLIHTMPAIAARSEVKGYLPNWAGEEVLSSVDIETP